MKTSRPALATVKAIEWFGEQCVQVLYLDEQGSAHQAILESIERRRERLESRLRDERLQLRGQQAVPLLARPEAVVEIHGGVEMEDSVRLAAGFTLEQVALWVAGGLIGKGLHATFKAVAPTV